MSAPLPAVRHRSPENIFRPLDVGLLAELIAAVEGSMVEQRISHTAGEKATVLAHLYERALRAGELPPPVQIDRCVWLG